MSAAAKTLRRARRVFARRGGMLRTSDAIRPGVHPRVLSELRPPRGPGTRVRGFYRLTTRLTTEEPLTNPGLVAVAMRINTHTRRKSDLQAITRFAWRAPMSRPTIDIELAGRTSKEGPHSRVPG